MALELETRITKEEVKYKSGAFSDDVGAVCKGDASSVQGIFTQYDYFQSKKRNIIVTPSRSRPEFGY